MEDWNVVVSTRDGAFNQAMNCLRSFGTVHRTGLYNVVVMRVADVAEFLNALHERFQSDPRIRADCGRIVPVTATFSFQSPEDFEKQAADVARRWAAQLAGKKFHVRMHRRGFQGRLSSQHEEQFLDHVLLEELARTGQNGTITFDDPDFIIAVETVGNRAGLSLWSNDDLKRYPIVKLD
jgi:tRNA(Ser,Leu) C12 N-acetylase TAN1